MHNQKYNGKWAHEYLKLTEADKKTGNQYAEYLRKHNQKYTEEEKEIVKKGLQFPFNAYFREEVPSPAYFGGPPLLSSSLYWQAQCSKVCLMLILCLTLLITTPTAALHMLCQTTEGKQFSSFPQSLTCSAKLPPVGTRPVSMSITMYKRNHIQYKSEAWICKKLTYT